MRARAFLPLLVAAALTLPAVAADHSQTENGKTLVFDHKTGNEWWVEVVLKGASAGAVTSVDARDTGGDWTPLTLRSWGAWAASFRIEPGHTVEFRASFADGTTMLSCAFTHPAGVEQCETTPPPPPGDFQATFSGVKGNEWWVQTSVSATGGTLSRVDVRLDGGDWRALQDKGWGWAASYHAPEGTIVQFRAVSSTGAESLSGCYRWTAASAVACGDQPPPPPPGDFTATFSNVKGNEWWVEAKVKASKPLAGVDARIVGGDWRPLTLRSWGAWAASFHIPDGSHVELRARATSGESVVSGRYVWPSATPVDGGGGGTSWPAEGSYVRYFLDSGTGLPGYSDQQFVWLNYTYTSGAWRGTCEGWDETDTHDGFHRKRINTTIVTAPPPLGGPKSPQPGESRELKIPSCGDGSTHAFVDNRIEISKYHGTEVYRKNGQPVTIPVWTADYEDDGCPCQWRAVAWHPDTGLTIDYVIGYRYSSESGHLVDTDAPVSKADTSTPPAPAWPKEGSFVAYQVNLTDDSGVTEEQLDVRFEYRSGAWQMTCTARPGETFHRGPPLAPPTTERGALVRPTEAWQCHITPPPVIVQGRFPHDTTRNGAFHRATVWWADEDPNSYGDEDAWWDVSTGLLLKWEDQGGYFRGDNGWLTNTDAPLSSG